MTDTILKLISLPQAFSRRSTVSMYDLLHEVGYANIAGQISKQDLYQKLLVYPDFVNDWLEYSENKRCAGWYFKLNDANKYAVGCIDENGNTETEYDDKLKACAVFVKQELDQILKK